MSYPTTVITERLLLRTWRDSDIGQLAAILGDAEVMRYMWGKPQSVDESRAALGRRFDHWERHGFGFWAMELPETGELAGWVGLQYADWLPELSSEVEVGWMLGRDHWGRGLATEGAAAALDAGFVELGLARIIGIHHPENVRSQRVMEKLGMRWAREMVDPTDGNPITIRDVTAEGWRRHRLEYAGTYE